MTVSISIRVDNRTKNPNRHRGINTVGVISNVVFFSHYRNASFSEPTFRSERALDALGRKTGKESGSERPPLHKPKA